MPDATLQTLPVSYTWGFAGSPIQIHLSLDVVSRLRKQIQDSQKVTGAPTVCGLLTGETVKPGITAILDFRPLRTLSAPSVTDALDGARGEVVGFYRTTPPGIDSMSDEDRALAAKFFSHPGSVFLFVESGASIGDARFCFWGEGQIFDFPLMTFPFEPVELTAREAKRRLNRVATPPAEKEEWLSEPTPVSPPESVQKSDTPQPAPKRREAFLTGRLAPVLTTLVLASLLLAAFLYSRRGSSPPAAVPKSAAAPAEVPSPLGLSVERRGDDLRISWNGNAAQISKADFGMLLIRGNGVSRDVPLTAEELRAGSVMYASASDQLRFQLTVVKGGQVAREFLTIVMPLGAERANRRNLPSAPTGNSATGKVPEPEVTNASRIRREVRQFKGAPPLAAATHPGLAEPPPVTGTAPITSINPSLLNRPPVSPSPPISVSTPGSIDVPALRTPPVLSAEAQPPVAISQVVPPIPALLRGMIWKATSVDVNVAVDVTGKVVKAEASAKPGLHPLLRDAAVQAALRWKFQPAQFDGHPVPANIVLQFNFAPNR
jgi:protein TonB